MAHAEQLPSKRWRGVYQDSSGKRHRVPGTYSRKSDALDDAQETEVEAARQASATAGKLSAKTRFVDWWKFYQSERDPESQSRPIEWDIYKNHLSPQWDETAMNHISHREIQVWIDRLSRHYSPSYTRRIYNTFAGSLTEAMRAGVLSASPSVGIRLPRLAKRAKPYLSLSEFAVLAPHLPQPERDAVELLLETGLRPSELAGLHVHRIDAERRLLWVADVYLVRYRTIEESPKDEDVRAVPLTSRAWDILQAQLADRNLTTGCGFRHVSRHTGRKRPCKHPLVFYGSRGAAVHTNLLQRRLTKAAEATGIEPRSPYTARRGFATRLADGGADSFEIARVMGHSNLEETAGYVQQSPTGVARILHALDDSPSLRAVPDSEPAWVGVGSRGFERGVNLDKQGPAATCSEEGQSGG